MTAGSETITITAVLSYSILIGDPIGKSIVPVDRYKQTLEVLTFDDKVVISGNLVDYSPHCIVDFFASICKDRVGILVNQGVLHIMGNDPIVYPMIYSYRKKGWKKL